MSHPHLDAKNQERVRNYPGGNPLERYELIQSLSMRDNGKPSAGKLWFPSGGIYGYKRTTFEKSWFDELVLADFEGFKFPIPKCYDAVLTATYGDYMKLPPLEKRYPWYGADYFDADKPYTEYLSQCI